MMFGTDLTHGPLVVQLLRFSLPFLASALVQNFYYMADLIIVGHFAGASGMAAINVSGQIALLVTNLVIGLGTGGTVLVAQHRGAGRTHELASVIGTFLNLLLLVSLMITVFMCVGAAPLLVLLQTPEAALHEAKNYLLICGIGTVFVFGYNGLSAVLRGMGDSKHPLYFVAAGCVLNIALDLLFVGLWRWGASGAALATILSQAFSLLLCVRHAIRNRMPCTPRFLHLAVGPLRQLLRLGIPVCLQNTVTDISFLVLIAVVNTLGLAASAAVGAVSRLTSFAIMPGVAMMLAIAAMSAQNIGAGKPQRAARTMWTGMAMSGSLCFCMFLLAQVAPESLLRLFTADEAVVAAGCSYLRSFSLYFALEPIFFCLNGLFLGAGRTLFALNMTLGAALLVRIPAALVLGLWSGMGLFGAGFAAPLASIPSIACALMYYLSGRWKSLMNIPA